MYLTFDTFGTRARDWMQGQKVKNIMKKWFPSKFVQGVEVWGELTFYDGGVIETEQTKAIYRLLNTSASELRGQSFDGVERVWFQLRFDGDVAPTFTVPELEAYVENEIVKAGGSYSITVEVPTIFKFSSGQLVIDKAATLNSARGLTDRVTGSGDKKMIAAIMADIEGNAFDVSLKYVNTGLVYEPDVGYVVDNARTAIKVTATLKGSPDFTVVCSRLSGLYATSVYAQAVKSLYDVQVSDVVLKVDDSGWVDESSGNYVSGYTYYVKKNESLALNSKEFAKLLKRSLKTDYQEEAADALSSFGAFLVMAVAIVAAVLTGGTSMAAATTFGAFAEGAALAAAVLGVGALVTAGISLAMKNAGQYGNAARMGSTTVILGDMAKVLGILSLFAGIKQLLTNGFVKEMATQEALNKGLITQEMALTAGETVTIQMSGIQIANQVLSWINSAANEAMRYLSMGQQADISDKQRELREQEEALDELPSPMKMELTQWNFETYQFCEVNEKMQAELSPDNWTNKYLSKFFTA